MSDLVKKGMRKLVKCLEKKRYLGGTRLIDRDIIEQIGHSGCIKEFGERVEKRVREEERKKVKVVMHNCLSFLTLVFPEESSVSVNDGGDTLLSVVEGYFKELLKE